MKAFIEIDEIYPVFYIDTKQYGSAIQTNIPDEFYENYQQAWDMWTDIQDKLSQYYHEAARSEKANLSR